MPRKPKSISNTTSELVCRVPLLIKLYDNAEPLREAQFKGAPTSMTRTCRSTAGLPYEIWSRSWDFMPPEIVRPFATAKSLMLL